MTYLPLPPFLPVSLRRLCDAVRWRRALALLLVLAGLGGSVGPARAVELVRLEATRGGEQGVLLSFDLRFDLPPGVEGALQKGVALYFVAEAEVLRPRWYWFDKLHGQTRRVWRLTYQPLTFSYRVSFGGLSQTYASLPEALRSLQTATRWRIAEPLASDDDGPYLVQFRYRLDADQLPRPLQIGIAGRPEWQLSIARTIALPADK
ncbi:MAG: DUF4390 domain-containing protein [Burkholderiaceae bacterium]|nr:DUF4390 domain-containing protein [Burkholderiaceae bacterium]